MFGRRGPDCKRQQMRRTTPAARIVASLDENRLKTPRTGAGNRRILPACS
jgi:hypothetical protein